MAYRNSYTLDGVALTNVSGGYFPERSTGIRTVPAKRSANISYPGVDGEAFLAGAPYGPGGVAVTMYVEGADHQGLMQNYEFLNGLFLQRHKLLKLRHDYDSAGTVYREADVKCVASTQLKLLNMNSGLVDYALEIPKSFWRSAEVTWATNALGIGPFTYTLSGFTGGNAPITDSLIRIKGAVSGATITDVATGSSITLTAPLLATEYCVIDPVSWTARKQTSNTWALTGGTDYSNNVVSNEGFGSQFVTEPLIVGGALVYQATFSTSSPASSPVVEFRAKKAFL
jgi:hypothetical protein